MIPRARQTTPSPEQPAPVLLVSPDQNDHLVLPEILNHPHWEWRQSRSCRQALERFSDKSITVLICERDQRDGCWRDLLNASAELLDPPNVIVCSRLADDHLWAEVLNLGGYDVLMKPLDREEVARVVFSAWRSWTAKQVARKSRPKVLRAGSAPSFGSVA